MTIASRAVVTRAMRWKTPVAKWQNWRRGDMADPDFRASDAGAQNPIDSILVSVTWLLMRAALARCQAV